MASSHSHPPAMLGDRKLTVDLTLSRHRNLNKPLDSSVLPFLIWTMRMLTPKYLCYWFPKGFLRAKSGNTSKVLKYYANVTRVRLGSSFPKQYSLTMSQPTTTRLNLLNTARGETECKIYVGQAKERRIIEPSNTWPEKCLTRKSAEGSLATIMKSPSHTFFRTAVLGE